jgi:hypothetical protein
METETETETETEKEKETTGTIKQFRMAEMVKEAADDGNGR